MITAAVRKHWGEALFASFGLGVGLLLLLNHLSVPDGEAGELLQLVLMGLAILFVFPPMIVAGFLIYIYFPYRVFKALEGKLSRNTPEGDNEPHAKPALGAGLVVSILVLLALCPTLLHANATIIPEQLCDLLGERPALAAPLKVRHGLNWACCAFSFCTAGMLAFRCPLALPAVKWGIPLSTVLVVTGDLLIACTPGALPQAAAARVVRVCLICSSVSIIPALAAWVFLTGSDHVAQVYGAPTESSGAKRKSA